MKLDIIKTFVAVLLGAIATYIISLVNNDVSGMLFPIVAGIESVVILIAALGLKVDWLRTMANIKISSWVFFFLLFVLNFIFAKRGVSVSAFVITNGILIAIFILLFYSLIKANKK